MDDPIPRLRTLLWRGIRRRCPQCGRGPLFRRWLTMHEHCPVCGLHYLPNQGDLWGFLLLADRALFILPLICLIYFRLYNPHSAWFYILGIGLVLLLVLTLPHRNGMSLAIDYLIRRKCGDLVDPEKKPKSDG